MSASLWNIACEGCCLRLDVLAVHMQSSCCARVRVMHAAGLWFLHVIDALR